MYTLDDLSVMLLSELRAIAEELQIKNAKKTAKQDLIYKILDHQATMDEADLKNIKSTPGKTPEAEAEELLEQSKGKRPSNYRSAGLAV